jgi:hypothetical protein
LLLYQDFQQSLEQELNKIGAFYGSKLHELEDYLVQLSRAIPESSESPDFTMQRTTSVPPSPILPISFTRHPRATSAPDIESPTPKFMTHSLKNLTDLYVLLSNLKEYAALNYQGFQKILKKYEKVTGQLLKTEFMKHVDDAFPFLESSKQYLEELLRTCIDLYARVSGKSNEAAHQILLQHLQERVVFTRNTIWKDMVEFERKSISIGLEPLAELASESAFASRFQWSLFGWKLQIPVISFSIWLIILGFLGLILMVQVPLFSIPEQNNCFAILVFVSYLWALEVFLF